ncbi:hypothetical protein [Amycolatopsis rubida]|uniref:hypothetical protein n=1 Tax=Amycolatopsis rubida TaxID=112413 RepID=UPI001160B51A|nr:hypothetical protein [Amycolatopsis rubida]
MSRNTIAKYLAVWDHMAEAGTVEDRKELAPGQDTKVPDIALTHPRSTQLLHSLQTFSLRDSDAVRAEYLYQGLYHF